jgi:hypothetical protein
MRCAFICCRYLLVLNTIMSLSYKQRFANQPIMSLSYKQRFANQSCPLSLFACIKHNIVVFKTYNLYWLVHCTNLHVIRVSIRDKKEIIFFIPDKIVICHLYINKHNIYKQKWGTNLRYISAISSPKSKMAHNIFPQRCAKIINTLTILPRPLQKYLPTLLI